MCQISVQLHLPKKFYGRGALSHTPPPLALKRPKKPSINRVKRLNKKFSNNFKRGIVFKEATPDFKRIKLASIRPDL